MAPSAPAPSPEPTVAATMPSPADLMSEPPEYDIARVSRDAGEAIFARTGVGDPYRTGVPYPIFLALQRAFPGKFGANGQALAAKYGFIARTPVPSSPDLDLREGLPLGMHLTVDPGTRVPFIVTNCSLCHAEKVGNDVIIGLGNKRVRVHAYDRAWVEVAMERELTPEHIAKLAREAAAEHHIEWPDTYADTLVAATITAIGKRAGDHKDLVERTAADPPGRVATIESFALTLQLLTHHPVQHEADIGWAKIPDVIGFAQRTSLSWDGSGQGSMDLQVVEADVAIGLRAAWLERHPFQGASLGAYLRQPAPRPAFPGKIDRAAAARGRKAFDGNCAPCHGTYGDDGRVRDYTDHVIAIADVGTDPARMAAPTATFEAAANDRELTRGYTTFARSTGYVPPVLTNVWARGPYGHAGQWASLAVMATPPAQRADHVIYALDAPYDIAAIGIATRAANATPAAGDYVEDGTKPGFSVLGHPFLADLGARGAADVIEYLKTL